MMWTNRIVYYDYSTKNQSFIDVHNILKSKGIKNNSFMLIIFNKNLIGVDPRDPELSLSLKKQILEECMINYWYYIREVVRVPQQGGDAISFNADRSNIAQAWGTISDIDTWTTKPRANILTISSLVLLSWILLFDKNNKININGRLLDDAKNNIFKIDKIIHNIPSYLQFDNVIDINCKKIVITNTMTSNIINAKSLVKYNSNNFDCDYSYIDDAAFINKINDIVTNNEYKDNIKKIRMFTSTRNYYGRSTEEPIINSSKKWDESYYDYNIDNLRDIVNNTDTGLMYIEYDYKSLGLSEEWVNGQRRLLNIEEEEDCDHFKGEILLQWKEDNKK